jgi:hypothetical protein
MGGISIPTAAFRDVHLFDAADDCERIEPFAESHVQHFISDFANSTGDAEMWLQDQGIDKTCIATAEMLRVMCQSWLINPNAVYAVAGTAFWRSMKDLAYEAWNK